MTITYNAFPLELWVSRFYQRLSILEPRDIDPEYIARSLRIYLKVTDRRSYCFEDGNFRMININEKLGEEERREVFFHELCHSLRHAGYQFGTMPVAFRDLQEREANHFTRYAAIPFHMLDYIDWRSPTLVKDMSEVFKVSEELCQYRVEHIHRNWVNKETKEEVL